VEVRDSLGRGGHLWEQHCRQYDLAGQRPWGGNERGLLRDQEDAGWSAWGRSGWGRRTPKLGQAWLKGTVEVWLTRFLPTQIPHLPLL
jgi:hypothetical protein